MSAGAGRVTSTRERTAGDGPGQETLVHQVKLFKGIESGLGDLEAEINTWLRESGARVVSTFGNLAPQTLSPEASGGGRSFLPSDVFLAIVYESE
jgi:hypothetical protein